jgi:hypothetical protein
LEKKCKYRENYVTSDHFSIHSDETVSIPVLTREGNLSKQYHKHSLSSKYIGLHLRYFWFDNHQPWLFARPFELEGEVTYQHFALERKTISKFLSIPAYDKP